DPRQRCAVDDRRLDDVARHRLQRGVEDHHVVAGPLPDDDHDDRREQQAGAEEVRAAEAERVRQPGERANCGSRRNDHITAATTAGTANGMKKTVRKKVPYFATPRSKTQAKKNAIASITGIWIAPKATTRITPDQNWPDCRVWV